MKVITYFSEYHMKPFFLISLTQMRRILFRPYHLFRQSLKMNVWSISSTHNTQEDLKILFVGKKTDQNFFSDLIFKKLAVVTFIGKMWPWRVWCYLLKFRGQYDIFIWQNKKSICNLLSSKNRFVIPDWVSCEIDLCLDMKASDLFKKNMKRNIKRITDNGFSYTISRDPSDFNLFYYQMYLPYVSEKYKNALVKISYDTIKENFEKGELILIKDGQKIISGGIINYSMMNGIPRGTQLGVYNGDKNYVKNGALTAYYYFAIKYLRENGFHKFSLGGTRPFYNDGVLKHKLSWGAKITNESSNAFLFCLLSKKKSLKAFLLNNPFICISRKNLKLAVFDHETSSELKKMPVSEKKLNSCGIDSIAMVHL